MHYNVPYLYSTVLNSSTFHIHLAGNEMQRHDRYFSSIPQTRYMEPPFLYLSKSLFGKSLCTRNKREIFWGA